MRTAPLRFESPEALESLLEPPESPPDPPPHAARTRALVMIVAARAALRVFVTLVLLLVEARTP